MLNSPSSEPHKVEHGEVVYSTIEYFVPLPYLYPLPLLLSLILHILLRVKLLVVIYVIVVRVLHSIGDLPLVINRSFEMVKNIMLQVGYRNSPKEHISSVLPLQVFSYRHKPVKIVSSSYYIHSILKAVGKTEKPIVYVFSLVRGVQSVGNCLHMYPIIPCEVGFQYSLFECIPSVRIGVVYLIFSYWNNPMVYCD